MTISRDVGLIEHTAHRAGSHAVPNVSRPIWSQQLDPDVVLSDMEGEGTLASSGLVPVRKPNRVRPRPAAPGRVVGTRDWLICIRQHDQGADRRRGRRPAAATLHDEAVALAAGYRPCSWCRPYEYNGFRRAWGRGNGGGPATADAINRALQAERTATGPLGRLTHPVTWSELPSGAFVVTASGPALVLRGFLVPWAQDGYGSPVERPSTGVAGTLTPPSTVRALQAGYMPQVDIGAVEYLQVRGEAEAPTGLAGPSA